MTKHILQGWSLADLSQTAKETKSSFEELGQSSEKRCLSSGCRITSPTLRTYDAGQAYESVSVHRCLRTVEYVVRRAKDMNLRCMQSLFKGAAHVSPTRRMFQAVTDRMTLSPESILRCVRSYLHFHVYKMGNVYLLQTKGVPIGGPLSGALLDVTQASAEYWFDNHTWKMTKELESL